MTVRTSDAGSDVKVEWRLPFSSSDVPGRRYSGRDIAPLVLPLALCAAAVAVLMVALGYAASRMGYGGAVPLFWSGQVLMLVAAAAVLLAPNQSRAAVYTAVVAYSVGQWLMRVAYAPTRLEFADEMQHQRSTFEILQNGHLFPVNYSLPISSVYPGLEAVTVGLTRITGLALHPAALLTAGMAHTLGAAALLVFLRAVTPDARAGALASLAYLVGSYAVFSTVFAYQTLAIPLAVLVVAQTLELGRSRDHARRLMMIAVLSGLVVVTHHLTSFLLLPALACLALGQALHRPSRRAAAWTAAATGVHAVLLVGWTMTVARTVVGYLGPPLQELVSGVSDEPANTAAPGVGQPLVERAFTYGAILVPMLGLSLAALVAWRRAERGIAALAATAVVVELAVIAIRFVASHGTELAGRAFAFTALVTAAATGAVVAAVRDRRLTSPVRHRPALSSAAVRRVRLAAGVVLLVLAVGGTTAGWPPRYERLPTYQVAGYESAMDRHTLEAATWADHALVPGNRVGADFGNVTAFGTVGNQTPIRGSYAEVLTDPASAAAADAVQRYRLDFVVADSRLSQQLPPPDRGTWFNYDVRAGSYTSPVSPEALAALDRVPGIDRVFDDGTIRVYDLRRSAYAIGAP